MSAINANLEVVPPGSVPARAAGRGAWPVHCATEMEIAVPALGGAAADYTFESAAEPVRLPPVWRCRCGFQLDAWATDWPELAEEPLASEQHVPAIAVGA